MNQPLDKGRVSVIVEKYPTGQYDNQQQPIMKNRYATVGRATMWPAEQGRNNPNIDIEVDTLPIGLTGSLKLFIFWDSEQQSQQPQQQQPQYQPQQQNNYANRR